MQSKNPTQRRIKKAKHRRRKLFMRINARPRPYVSISGPFVAHRPADWHIFGFEKSNREIERRKAIARLMTKDEIDAFNRYCSARDDLP